MSFRPTASLQAFQRAFADRLLEPRGALAAHQPGFDVHWDNVRLSLRQALASAFPVVRQLVGEGFFATLVDRFVVEAPPRHGWLSAYGEGFADFTAGYAPAEGVAYLADVARLEWARVRAANGPDTPGLDLGGLAALAPVALEGLVLALHPSASLIRSPWSVLDIWSAHQGEDVEQALARIDLERPQAVLVTRTASFEISVCVVGPGEAALLSAAASGFRFGAACEAAMAAELGCDLGEGLTRLAWMQALRAEAWG